MGGVAKLESTVYASAMASSPVEPSEFSHFLDDEFLSHRDIFFSHFQGCVFHLLACSRFTTLEVLVID